MAADCAEISRVGKLEAGFQQVQLYKISEIFTILLGNINNLKTLKNSKQIISYKKFSKNPVYYRNGIGQTNFIHKINFMINI